MKLHKFSTSHGESGPGTSWTRQIRRPFAGPSSRSKRAGKIWCPGRGYQVVPRWWQRTQEIPKKSPMNLLLLKNESVVIEESMLCGCFFLKYFLDIWSKYSYRWTIYDVNTCLYRSTIDTIDISIVVGFVGYCIENSITTDLSTILRLHPN